MSGGENGSLSLHVGRDGVRVRITPASSQAVSFLLSPDEALDMAKALVGASETARLMISGPDVVGHG